MTNPFNGKKSYVSYEDTKFIVFWSKNPRPLLNHIDYLREEGLAATSSTLLMIMKKRA